MKNIKINVVQSLSHTTWNCKYHIVEAEVCPDHIHMLLSIPPKYSVSSVMGFLKGKSSIMIYSQWGNMR